MKKMVSRFNIKALFILAGALFYNIIAMAQDNTKVEVNGHNVGNWFSNNWLWITGIILVLLILLLISGGSSRSRTITTVKKDDGYITRTTTTDIE